MSDHEILDWLERLSVPSGVDMSGNFITRPVVQEVRVWSPDIRGDELEEMNFTHNP